MFKSTKPEVKAVQEGESFNKDVSDHWADVQFSVLRQMVDVGRVNGRNVLMVVFERVTSVLRVWGPGPPPTSMKDLLRQTRQAEQFVPVTRRRYLENNTAGANQRQRQQNQENANAVRARQAAHHYTSTEQDAWNAIQRPNTLSDVVSLVDDRIREARKAGEFDDLPGRGKPINFDDRPQHVDSTTFIMNRIIKNQGGTLDWVDRGKDIDDAADRFRKKLSLHWSQCQRSQASLDWQRALGALADELKEVNRLVRNYNLSVPVPRMQRWGYTMERELEQLYKEEPPFGVK